MGTPCVASIYLVNLKTLEQPLQYTADNNEIYCMPYDLLEKWPFVLLNDHSLSHRISTTYYPTNLLYPEFVQIFANRWECEKRYLPKDWAKTLAKATPEQPCPDGYWFPLITTRFCTELILMAESVTQWNLGTNYIVPAGEEHPNQDPFPTVDVDLDTLNLYDLWLQVATTYITPLRKTVFGAYVLSQPLIDTTIVIKYKPEEQGSNEPHHDGSTYTINLALNVPGIHFEGGGCRFLRENCSVTDGRVGWILIHPGDLIHYHEGLSTTAGTRYILVSFIDPRLKDIDCHPLKDSEDTY